MTPLPHRYTVELSGGPSGYGSLEADGLPQIRIAPPRQYGGPGDAWTPEHLLLAAVESCFLFTFRAVAAAAHVSFECLELSSEGTVDRQNGRTKFTKIVLRPRVAIDSDADRERVMQLLHKAERACLVSASLDTPVQLEPELVSSACAV